MHSSLPLSESLISYTDQLMLQENYMKIIFLHHPEDVEVITAFHKEKVAPEIKNIHDLKESKSVYAEIGQAWQEEKTSNLFVHTSYGILLKIYRSLHDFEFLKQKNTLSYVSTSSPHKLKQAISFTELMDAKKEKKEKKQENDSADVNRLKLEVLSFFKDLTRDEELNRQITDFNEIVNSQFSAIKYLDGGEIELEEIIALEKEFASVSEKLRGEEKVIKEKEDAYFYKNIAKIIKEMPENKKEKLMRLMQIKLGKSCDKLNQIKRENEEKSKREEERYKLILQEITILEKFFAEITLPRKSIFRLRRFDPEIISFLNLVVTKNQESIIKYRTNIFEQRAVLREELAYEIAEIDHGSLCLWIHYFKQRMKKKEVIQLHFSDQQKKNQEKIDGAWNRHAKKIVQPFKEELEIIEQNITEKRGYTEAKGNLLKLQDLYNRFEFARFKLVEKIEEIGNRPKSVLDKVFAPFFKELAVSINTCKDKCVDSYSRNILQRLVPFKERLASIQSATPKTNQGTLQLVRNDLEEFESTEEKEVTKECKKLNQSPGAPYRIMTPVKKMAKELGERLIEQQQEKYSEEKAELCQVAPEENKKNLVHFAATIKPPVIPEHPLPEYNWCYAILLGLFIPIIGFFIYGCYYRRQYNLAQAATAIPAERPENLNENKSESNKSLARIAQAAISKKGAAANSSVFRSNNIIRVLLAAQNEPDSAKTPGRPGSASKGSPFDERRVTYDTTTPKKRQNNPLRKSQSQNDYPSGDENKVPYDTISEKYQKNPLRKSKSQNAYPPGRKRGDQLTHSPY